jgi:hypothetical protein
MADPINGTMLGDCPYCVCPSSLNVIGPDNVVWVESKVAEIIAPSYTSGGRDAPPSFGTHPRGAYFIRYCGGAVNLGPSGAILQTSWYSWQRFTNLRFNEIVGCYTVFQTGGSVGFTPLNIPPSDLSHPTLPFVGLDPAFVDWLNSPVGTFPGPSNYALPAAWPANFDYEPAVSFPDSIESKSDAQRGGSCMVAAFYHGGGPINVDYTPGTGFVTPWPPALAAVQIPPFPTYSLYRAKPAFYFSRLYSEAIGLPGTRTFQIRFYISNLSRGRWFALPRLTGGGAAFQILKQRGIETGGTGNFPLMHLPPGQTSTFVAAYTAPTTDFTLRIVLDDASGGATGIPSFSIPMLPQLHLTRVVRGNFFTSPFGNKSFRLNIYLRNSAVGPTSGNLKLTLVDTENITWPSPKIIDVVPLAGNGNTLSYRQNTTGGIPSSGVFLQSTTARWGTHVPADKTEFLLRFTLTDGPVNYGTFEEMISLD